MLKRRKMYTSKALKYLNLFGSKNLEGVRQTLSPEAQLRDWDNTANNREEFISVVSRIFEGAGNLSVEVLNTVEQDTTVVVEMKISVDDDDLLVTDVIEFESAGLITAVRAYLG